MGVYDGDKEREEMKGNPAPQAINCEGCGDLCYFRGENP